MPISLQGSRDTSIAAEWAETIQKNPKPGLSTGTEGKGRGPLSCSGESNTRPPDSRPGAETTGLFYRHTGVSNGY